jgi:adenylate cyclase
MKRQFRISIRAGLVFGCVALVISTAALVHFPWVATARAGVTDLAIRLNGQLIDDVRAKMSALMDAAAAAEKIIASNIRAASVDLSRSSAREAFLLSFIESRPTTSSVEIGWLDGRSHAVRRINDGTIVSEELVSARYGKASLTQNARYRADENGNLTRERTDDTPSDYSVLDQLWFKQAFDAQGASWTGIYRRAYSGKLAFTLVEAVTPPNGEVLVIAITMELDRISQFLDTVVTGGGSTVFLTNTYGELVAASDGMLRTGSDNANISAGLKLLDSDLPLVPIAARALAANGIDLSDLREARQLVFRPDNGTQDYYVTVSPLTQAGFIVGLAVPESTILGAIARNTERLAYVIMAFVGLMAALVAPIAARTLGHPLALVTRNARLLGEFRFDEIKQVQSPILEVETLSQAVTQMSASLASFRKYVPTEVVRMLFSQGIEAELGGSRRELSILFMDLANFTQISEALGDEVISFIGEFLSEMSDEIRDGGGTIDKYIGDAIMALWGAPARNDSHALHACRTALACQRRLHRMHNQVAQARDFELTARIGINTGQVLVGNVGSYDRLNYTAIGDPVNVASRLEPLNKRYGSEILIGEATYLVAKDHIVARRLDRVAVYGRMEGIQVYELVALAEDIAPETVHWVATYEHGIAALVRREWEQAESLFHQVIALRGGKDVPSSLMIERCRMLRAASPQADWDGILKLTEK